MKTKKILIADDHSTVRAGLKQILSNEYSCAEFGEANTVLEVFKRLSEQDWDLLILDISMPGRNGFEVLEQIREMNSNISVLIFSMHDAVQFAYRAFKTGADGYVSKAEPDTELLKAVEMILSGRKYIPMEVAEILAEELEHPNLVEPHKKLSNREFQTFLMLASGKGITEIATELHLSASSINTYRQRILQKMDMDNNSQLMKYAIKNNLI